MIPNNQEHLEAHQAATNKKREEWLARQSPEIKAKFAVIENAAKDLSKLQVPFSLHVNPFGWDFDWNDEDRKGYWWFGKLHNGPIEEPSTRQSNKLAQCWLFSIIGDLACPKGGDKYALVTVYDKKTNIPQYVFHSGETFTPPNT